MRNRLLILGILGISILSCTNEKKNDTGVVENVINEITTPKLFVEGEWVLKDDPYINTYTKPYYIIEAINDSTLLFKINAYQGGEKYKYSEKKVKINNKSDTQIIATDIEYPNLKYYFNIKDDGITMSTGFHSRYFIPFK